MLRRHPRESKSQPFSLSGCGGLFLPDFDAELCSRSRNTPGSSEISFLLTKITGLSSQLVNTRLGVNNLCHLLEITCGSVITCELLIRS